MQNVEGLVPVSTINVNADPRGTIAILNVSKKGKGDYTEKPNGIRVTSY